MGVLTCPVCQGEMREVARSGVMIDTCTRCRGVWLDRGELEKLSAMFGGDRPQDDYDRRPRDDYDRRAAAPPVAPYRRDDDDDDDRHKYGHGHGKPYQKSKMSRLLDFFD